MEAYDSAEHCAKKRGCVIITDEQIKAAAWQSGSDDPREIAYALVDTLAEFECREALEHLLPQYIRGRLGRDRRRHVSTLQTGRPKCAECGKRGLHQPGCSKSATSRIAGLLEELHLIRSLLPQRVSVDGVWKQLGDCRAEDLNWLAGDLRKRAREEIERAELYESLANDMNDLHADTLAGLVQALEEVAA
jgi:hypothetical protein